MSFDLVRFDNILQMQSSHSTEKMIEKDTMIKDPISQNTYSLQNGDLCVRSSQDNSEIYRCPLPRYLKVEKVPRIPLKFRKINNGSIVFDPSGRHLISKSQKIHEVDMNMAYSQGVALWSISCSPNCLSLIVGVKNTQKKKEHSLEFTIQNTTKILFKLDLIEKKFKAWVDKIQSIVEKLCNLAQDVAEWTPFVRVKGVGINLFLSQFAADPQGKFSIYNVLKKVDNNNDFKIQLVQKKSNSPQENFKLKMIDDQTLLLHSNEEIRLIRRTKQERQFNLNFGYYCEDGNFYVKFNESQIEILKQVGFLIQGAGSNYCGKTLQNWKFWFISAFKNLDSRLASPQKSKQLALRSYQILLSKLQSLSHLQSDLSSSPAFGSDLHFALPSLPSFPSLLSQTQTAFKIPQSIYLNNDVPFRLAKNIKQILWTEHFLIILIEESERIVILNREWGLFRIGEINLRKAFKKEYELNQYQKELDNLQSNNANQPSIYKILKNCLRYADKVKAPEKQKQIKQSKKQKRQKQKQRQRQKEKSKKADEIIPNESMVNTLLGMGFTVVQAKQALIEAKNSLQKAIQLIFSQAQKQPKPQQSTSTQLKTWDCPQCTLINESTAQTCIVCAFPKPDLTQLQAQQKLNSKMQQNPKQLQPVNALQPELEAQQQQIESKTFDPEIKLQKIFAWESGFAYCPLFVAGAFGSKLRIRLFGPNIKFYSIFYNKDEQYVDMNNLTIHDQAHEIGQKMVRYQYFSISSSFEQKQAAFGWISLEDCDIEIQGTIEGVKFKNLENSKKFVKLMVQIEGSLNQEKWNKKFEISIAIDKIYAQKKKAIQFQNFDESKEYQQLSQIPISLPTKKSLLNSKKIPKNGYLQLHLTYPSSSSPSQPSQILPLQLPLITHAPIIEKISLSKPYIPVLACHEKGSAQIATSSTPIQVHEGKKPIILKSLANKAMLVEYVVFQKIGKGNTNSGYEGEISLCEDVEKKAIKKIKFELQKGGKRFYIQVKQTHPTNLIKIQLSNSTKPNDSILHEQLCLIGLIGQLSPKSLSSSLSLPKPLPLTFSLFNVPTPHNKKLKITTNFLNSTYDLLALSSSQLEKYMPFLLSPKKNPFSDFRTDFCVRLYNLEKQDLQLDRVQLQVQNGKQKEMESQINGWIVTRTQAVWADETGQKQGDGKKWIFEEEYKEIIEKFLEKCQNSTVDQLNGGSDEYLRSIVDGKYNLTKFFKEHIVGKKIDGPLRGKLLTYFSSIAPFLQQIHKAGNFDYQQILKQLFANSEDNQSSIEFVLEILKNFPIQQQIIVSDIIKRLKKNLQKQQTRGKKPRQQIQQQNNLLNYKQSSLSSQHLIYNRYIVKKGKLYRKYTIDMVNAYRIKNINLLFQRSHKKSPIRITLKSLTSLNKWKVEFDQFYPQHIFEQLSVSSSPDNPQKSQKSKSTSASASPSHTSPFSHLPLNLPPLLARYLQLEISFTYHPNIGSSKDIEQCPQSEIIPEIYGEYAGQCQISLDIFKNTDIGSLAFVKNFYGINKFNLKNHNNLYYYDTEQVQSSKKENQMGNANKQKDTKLAQGQGIQDNKTSYRILCMELEQILGKKGSRYDEELLNVLSNAVANLDRNVLNKKIILFLKKLAKESEQAAAFIFRKKLPNQYIYNSILKDSKLNLEVVDKILQNNPTEIQVYNAVNFLKSRQTAPEQLQLFDKILSLTLNSKKIEDTASLHQKYGWVQNTPRVLNLAIAENKKKFFKNVISHCKDNKKLADYAESLLKTEQHNDYFATVFHELSSQSRNLKQCDTKSLLQTLITHLSSSLSPDSDSYDENEILEKFLTLTTFLSHSSLSSPSSSQSSSPSILQSYLTLFSKLPNKQTILNKFLHLKHFKQSKNICYLIDLVINLLTSYLESKKEYEQKENLSLIYEIMIFIFRNEGQYGQNVNETANSSSGNDWLESVIESQINKLAEVIGRFIISQLCFGGEQHSKIVDTQKRMKISIGFCLANLVIKLAVPKGKFKEHVDLGEKCVRNMLKWLMVNQNINQSQGAKPSTTHFGKIIQAVWQLVIVDTTKRPEKVIPIFRQQLEKQQAEISKIKDKVYRKLFQRRLLNTCNEFLNKVQQSQISHQLIQSMFTKFLNKIIQNDPLEYEYLSQSQKSDAKNFSLVQKQFANNFQLQKQPNSKPKDWLIYKNGAKNSVFKFQYPKGPQPNYQLLLKLPSSSPSSSFTLSKILLSFQLLETAQDSFYPPREITLQAGPSLSSMKYLGKMTPLPDNHYINYSVRVYGFDCVRIQNGKINSLNRNPEVKYLKITMRCPEMGYVAQGMGVVDKAKAIGGSINFLSVQGYGGIISAVSEFENVQSFIKKISSFKYKESLKKLFANPDNVKLFKDSLINLSTIMKNEQFSDDINKFIMRVCQVNTQIGNETIEKYLHLGNAQTCAKIVSQIILSNEQSLKPRITILHNFIIKNLQDPKISSQILRSLEPFLNKFSKIVYAVQKMPNTQMKIPLAFNTKNLQEILQLQHSSTAFSRYLCTIIKLSHPFTAQNLQIEQIYKTLKLSPLALNKETLLSLVVSDKNVRSLYMRDSQLQKVYETIVKTIKSKSSQPKPQTPVQSSQPQLQSPQSSQLSIVKAGFDTLSSLCFNTNIKSIINKSGYNLDIFNLLTSQAYSGMLVGEANTQLRESFVNFITRSVLGSDNQLKIAEILKESLTKPGIQQNKYFVGQVFLPILSSYSKTTICMHPYDDQQKKILVQLALKSNPKSPSPGSKSLASSSKFRLPTNLLSTQSKIELFQKIHQKCKYSGGNFNMIANHGEEANGMFEIIQKEISKNNQSILFLIRGENKDKKEEILGIFYKEAHQIRKFPLNWNEGCLVFTINDKEPINFLDISKQSGKRFLSFYEENKQSFEDLIQKYEQKIIEINYQGVPFCQISCSHTLSPSYLNLDILHGTSFGQSKLSSAEYWLFQPTSSPSQSSLPSSQPSLTSSILSLYSSSFFQPSFQSKSILRLLRYDKIYEFPSSLTFKQLKLAIQIMKCKIKEDKEKQIKIRMLDFVEINQENTIQAIGKKIEDNTPIVDLLCDVREIGEFLDYGTDRKQATLYLPKRGIMKHFEQIDGVTSMIRVIKVSIQGWKNKERREKWYQYVLELEKFSSFPHFFGMYLKDNETFDLLFKLLSGLPDTEQDKKWDQLQSKSTLKLLKIIAQILNMDKTTEFRQYAMKHDFFKTILERLKILTGQFKRQWKQIEQKQEEQVSPSKQTEDDGTKQVKKKKGVGYGNDGSSNTKWMKGVSEAQLMKEFQVTQIILNIIENFLDLRSWNVPKKVLENIYQSALLPYLEDSLRAGTLLQISKLPAKFKLVFKIIRTLAKNPHLVTTLLPLNKNYHPRQTQSLQSLLKSLENTATIFLSCLTTNKDSPSEKISIELSKDIIQTYKKVQQQIQLHNDSLPSSPQTSLAHILSQPLAISYRTLLKDLRFAYIDMKESPTKIKHHYSSSFTASYTPNQNKMIRLAQELADISTALPYEHTNAIYVRCDKDRVDFMQALIMGANGTPYGHGAFLFDVYFDDNYPNGPPKVNLTTTGHGKVRFNPNLYACGKVCLSLLGTWRGSASENWDPKVSTLLQVLVSIQAIIMSQEIYFNQPGFEGEQGTPEGEKKNQAYSNIVRYSNIKFAMIENMRNPPKGFEHVIRRHFYLKQHEIMEECKKWLLYAEKRQANYIGLVNDHNNSWSTEFKKSKNQYKQMLQKAIEQLEQQFKKLPAPSPSDIPSLNPQKKVKKPPVPTSSSSQNALKKLEQQNQQQIDVAYDSKSLTSLSLDINDEKVKDRWSRYIGAMGIDAVSKQSKADIMVFGLGPLGMEIVKNIVLSGCRKLTIVDQKLVQRQDLSGGFFYTEADIGKKRIDLLYKIRQLNGYVKIDTMEEKDVKQEVMKGYNLVFVSEMGLKEQFALNEMCRANGVKFISGEFRGAYCRVLNDFGEKFQVLDKNGQEPVQVIIKNITNAPNGVVTLLDGSKHPYEDGEVILIKNVQGMNHKQDKQKSINNTLHKVKVLNSKSFQIGDTTIYQPYIRNGLAKNVKTPVFQKFQSMKLVYENAKQKLPIDENLQYFDFTKMNRNKMVHFCFVALDTFIQENGKMPQIWDLKDGDKFVEIFAKAYGEELNDEVKKYVRRFSFTCRGYLPPLGAFFGGFLAQEIIKAITQKYKPLDSVYYMDAQEVIPDVSMQQKNQQKISQIISQKDSRDKGFQIVVGKDLLQQIKNSTSFMIGSGAIGCQLLKNFAMIGLGTGEKGKITLTDPDHIENSNLNRQFLFRQKHISKPKSRTAAASVVLMNQNLKGHISALLERVSQSTKNIFSNKFFESLTFVANALDNVAARRYVDQRCVQNKVPLFQSGTLGPKGHTQVILPYKTESYGSQQDPVQEGQIPHCTLKMFPQQTLHCVQWARDIFGKKFSLQPKAFNKIKDPKFKPQKDDIKSLNQCMVMATKGPKNFEDCISYAITKFYKYFRDDILQLMYTYPLDAKTKDGQPFWKLPKRPPTAIMKFDPDNILHCTFISSMSVMVAKVYKIPYPKNFRQQKQRYFLGKQASKIKIPDFVPSDEKSKTILKQTATNKKQKQFQEQQKQTQTNSDQSQLVLHENFIKNSKDLQVEPDEFEKDNDQNGHIDFIYSMANLRAWNYKLDQMDWITTKIKAGRIVPALATTTTCVAGLQTLEICKYIRKLKIDGMRNSFLNLAVPSLQMSEPGQVKKIKLNEKVQVNLWDRWEIECHEGTTFEDVYKELRKRYEIVPIGVLQGMSRIDTNKTEEGKKQFMKTKVLDRLDKEDDCIDIIVLFTNSENEQKLIQNVPPIRLKFTPEKSV